MPPLPWSRISTVDPGTEVTVVATRLPLRSYRHIPGFLRWTLRIRRQLAQGPSGPGSGAATSGLVGYSLDAHLLRKTFWTVSAWTGQAEIEAFVHQDPHAAGMVAIRPHMGESTFVFWTATAEDLPIRWADVRRRVEAKAATRTGPAPRPSRRG